MNELGIGGVWLYEPRVWPDQRGWFFELFRGQEFAHDLGYRLEVAQVNCSVSRRGVIRGIQRWSSASCIWTGFQCSLKNSPPGLATPATSR